MIFEALQHILIPAAEEVRALGYVREAIAIEARYKRCRTAWAGHLRQCRQQILAATAPLQVGSTIMILGSGALHDVPMHDLLARGHGLILIDIIHLPKVRKRYKNQPQVRLIEQDVTGLVRPLFHRDRISSADAETAVQKLPGVDLVISLNLLSQLPINLIQYATRHDIPLPANFEHDVMAAHLKMLASLAPRSLIISDHERSYLADQDVLEKESALPDSIARTLPKPEKTWDWHIAPKGELDKAVSLVHQVACWKKEPKTS